MKGFVGAKNGRDIYTGLQQSNWDGETALGKECCGRHPHIIILGTENKTRGSFYNTREDGKLAQTGKWNKIPYNQRSPDFVTINNKRIKKKYYYKKYCFKFTFNIEKENKLIAATGD